MAIDTLGHQFSVPPRPKVANRLSRGDASKLVEGLGVAREEPEQLKVSPIDIGESVEEATDQQRIEDSIQKLQEWMVAAEQMQLVLGDRLKDRHIRIDSKKNPAVRDAIRRLFGVDSDTITYDMFKKALKWRSELLKEGRNKTYGSSS